MILEVALEEEEEESRAYVLGAITMDCAWSWLPVTVAEVFESGKAR